MPRRPNPNPRPKLVLPEATAFVCCSTVLAYCDGVLAGGGKGSRVLPALREKIGIENPSLEQVLFAAKALSDARAELYAGPDEMEVA